MLWLLHYGCFKVWLPQKRTRHWLLEKHILQLSDRKVTTECWALAWNIAFTHLPSFALCRQDNPFFHSLWPDNSTMYIYYWIHKNMPWHITNYSGRLNFLTTSCCFTSTLHLHNEEEQRDVVLIGTKLRSSYIQRKPQKDLPVIL